MIRAVRRASLLVTFCVFTSAATAFAECAWVLWEKREVLSPKEESRAWQILEAYESKATCLEGAKQSVDIIAQSSIAFSGLGQREIVKSKVDTVVVEAYRDATTTVTHLLRCLPPNVAPDTVDPRGPKRDR